MSMFDALPSEPPRTVVPVREGDSLVLAARMLAGERRRLGNLPEQTQVSFMVPERFVLTLCAEVDRFLGQSSGTATPDQAEAYLAGYGVRVVWLGRGGGISLDESGLTVL